ncbi:hypothetical protein THAOC_01755 [Thalassiosira oceanica]|uniref:Uncharacterized protein n=1 Tax=Thalassiosira oceanica TaxID=159749 RepID=K0THJ1_THAOC|nr:hypothetical protein THAOC_01755 [Thalassiosira oceanica]|eukprot:EJK76479.1 hypothetical protein THAOC_01755 [Thalassiosira oceanica]
MVQNYGCVCNWSECQKYHNFFKGQEGHAWAGALIKLDYNPDRKNSNNFWKAVCSFAKPSHETKARLETKFEESKANAQQSGKNQSRVTFKIARHHFPTSVLSMEGHLTAPITAAQARQNNCYPDRNITTDTLLQFDTEGKSADWIKKNPGRLLVKAPTNARLYVDSEYIRCQPAESPPESAETSGTNAPSRGGNGPSRVRSSGHERIERQRVRMAEQESRLAEQERREQQRVQETEQMRTPAQWKSVIAEKETELGSKSQQIQTLQEQVAKLTKELEETRSTRTRDVKRLKYHADKSSVDNETSMIERVGLANDATIKLVQKLLIKVGGLSLLTLFSSEFHAHNAGKDVNAAYILFGYHGWEETEHYIGAYFPEEVNVNEDRLKSIDKMLEALEDKKKGKEFYLTAFEKCLTCRMFIRCFRRQKILALIMGKHRTMIGKILKEWMPKWANVGQDLLCLDITIDYLTKELPEYNRSRGSGAMVMLDGKDWGCSSKESDTNTCRATFSSKKDTDATRCITFSAGTGLVFEKTPNFCARTGEKDLVGLLGSRAEYERICSQIAEGDGVDCILESIGAVSDGVLLTGQPTGLARLGINAGDESSDESTGENEKSARDLFSIDDALTAYDNMVSMKSVDSTQKSTGKRKRTPLLTPEKLKEQNDEALASRDPNASGKTKLRQLERHQRLHILYETGQLRKCLLSYFLLVEEKNRLKLLAWMGSDLAGNTPKPLFDELPKVPIGLAKIPEGVPVAGDKGFAGLERHLPMINPVRHPALATKKEERQSEAMILGEVPLTSQRATCETVFDRVQKEEILREKIPYYLIPWIPHATALAHGEVNLHQPSRQPGRGAIVGNNYWTNVKDYTKVQQNTIQSKNVEESSKRLCTKCKEPGITLHCAKCGKWFHFNEVCHDFGDCQGHNPNNPYK